MRPTILNCSQNTNPQWRWLDGKIDANFMHIDMCPKNRLEAAIRRPALARYRAVLQAARAARESDLLVTHSPVMTMWTELLCRGRRPPHLAFSFNFTSLPRGAMLRLMRRALPSVERFVVFSSLERRLYADTFGIDPQRIDMLHWAVRPPTLADQPADVPNDYVCAVGGEGRDYRLFMDAMRRLPHIKAVVVARPYNLVGLEVPSNVVVRVDIPRGEANDIIRRSRFMVLPLLHSQVPCGHVTIVTAMYLERAILATASEGIADYVIEGLTGTTVAPGDPVALARGIAALWEDPARCAVLGSAGLSFAQRECTEQATIDYMGNCLAELRA